jgi:hypothetical protein
MTTRRTSLLWGLLLCLIASTSVAAASPQPLVGTIDGVEICPQSFPLCSNGALFTGGFTGKINGKRTRGAFLVQVSHAPLQTQLGAVTAVTGGSWIIRTKKGDLAGTIVGGNLTANTDNTFDVVLTLQITEGGSGTATFAGVLDHNELPPTITGTISP